MPAEILSSPPSASPLSALSTDRSAPVSANPSTDQAAQGTAGNGRASLSPRNDADNGPASDNTAERPAFSKLLSSQNAPHAQAAVTSAPIVARPAPKTGGSAENAGLFVYTQLQAATPALSASSTDTTVEATAAAGSPPATPEDALKALQDLLADLSAQSTGGSQPAPGATTNDASASSAAAAQTGDTTDGGAQTPTVASLLSQLKALLPSLEAVAQTGTSAPTSVIQPSNATAADATAEADAPAASSADTATLLADAQSLLARLATVLQTSAAEPDAASPAATAPATPLQTAQQSIDAKEAPIAQSLAQPGTDAQAVAAAQVATAQVTAAQVAAAAQAAPTPNAAVPSATAFQPGTQAATVQALAAQAAAAQPSAPQSPAAPRAPATGNAARKTDDANADAASNAAPAGASADALRAAFDRLVSAVTASHTDKSTSDSDAALGNTGITAASAHINDAQTAPQPVQTQAASPTDAGAFAKLVTASHLAPGSAADQVLVQVKNAAATGLSQIKIQLSPDDLGKVVVQLTTGADGKTGITVTADNRQTLAMLQREARSLETSLRDIGLKTDGGGLNFNLSGQQQQDPKSQYKQGGYTQVAGISAADDLDASTSLTALYHVKAPSGLDIRV